MDRVSTEDQRVEAAVIATLGLVIVASAIASGILWLSVPLGIAIGGTAFYFSRNWRTALVLGGIAAAIVTGFGIVEFFVPGTLGTMLQSIGSYFGIS